MSFNIKLKRGISGVIVWIIGIALVLVAVGIIWGVAGSFINKSVDRFGSCADVTGKVELNRQFTCQPTKVDWAVVSVSVGDIDIDGLKFTIDNGAGKIKTYELMKSDDGKVRQGMGVFGEAVGEDPFAGEIKFPKSGEGLTYILDASEIEFADSVKISAIVDGEDCGVVDSSNLKSCSVSVLRGAGDLFNLGCEIITPISANTIQRNAPIRFSHSGNPTHFRIVVGQFTGDNKEIELCRVGPQFDGSVTEEAITSSPQEYICNWKANGASGGNTAILDSAWNSD